MTPHLHKFALTVHVTASVGWLGSVIGFLTLVVTAITKQDAVTVRAAWIAMELIGWFAIVPLAFVSLLSGFVMSLGTKWGLFRYYWVLFKLMLTILSTIVLLLNMQTVSFFAGKVTENGSTNLFGMQGELIHAGGGLIVLIVITALSVYKPRGMTRYGQRKQYEQRKVSQ